MGEPPPESVMSMAEPSRGASRRVIRIAAAALAPLDRLGRNSPFVSFFLIVILSNVAGTVFNIFYNLQIIYHAHMDEAQKAAFDRVALPAYNGMAYPFCLGLVLYLLWPVKTALRHLRRGEPVPPLLLATARRRVLALPLIQVLINLLGWLPGAVVFPAVVCAVGGPNHGGDIAWHFVVSFIVSGFFTTAQTFFLMEGFLVKYLYPAFFRDARPHAVGGIWHPPFLLRLLVLWLAVAWMPLSAMYAIMGERQAVGRAFPLALFAVSSASSFVIFLLVGWDLRQWIRRHAVATEAIGAGDFTVQIEGQRPDEWGLLSNAFNDMAAALARGKEQYETFGQFLHPTVRDAVLERYRGLEVSVQDVTVVFADIRGFTRRTAGEPPEQVGALLNRFLTLALHAVEDNGGYVNKFLGDGVMALFGATGPSEDHADRALASARDLLARLGPLNDELAGQGQPPLAVGVGIHSGPALIGCFGATLDKGMRREFTAIGETVNFCQRVEQLTKRCGGPILLSEATYRQLREPDGLVCLGPQAVDGAPAPLVVYRAGEGAAP